MCKLMRFCQNGQVSSDSDNLKSGGGYVNSGFQKQDEKRYSAEFASTSPLPGVTASKHQSQPSHDKRCCGSCCCCATRTRCILTVVVIVVVLLCLLALVVTLALVFGQSASCLSCFVTCFVASCITMRQVASVSLSLSLSLSLWVCVSACLGLLSFSHVNF